MSLPTLFTPVSSRGQNNFNFLRLVLSVAVVFTHSYVVLSSNFANQEPFDVISHQQMTLGSLAVDFFFIISGFLITQSWMQSTCACSYLQKRILRIYPAFIVVTIVCALVVGPLGAADPLGYIRAIQPFDFITKLLNLNEPIYSATFLSLPCPWAVDAPVWTLRYEFGCYLLVLILGVIGALRFKWVPVIVFIVSLGFVIHQDFNGYMIYDWKPYSWVGVPDDWPRFIEFFSVGMIYFFYRDRIPRLRWLSIVSVVLVIASIFTKHDLDLTLPFFGSYALLYLASSQKFDLHKFGSKVDMSYGIYIWAWPIQQLLVLYYQRMLDPITLFVTATLLSAVAATLSWLLIEKPALSLKRKKIHTHANPPLLEQVEPATATAS